MPYLWLIGALILAGMVGSVVQRYQNHQKLKNTIEKSYGHSTNRPIKPEAKLLYERFGVEETETMEAVDSVTWSDLEMDLIYSRINQCYSYVGEQVLYQRLHEMHHDSKEQADVQEVLEALVADPKKRDNLIKRLNRLGKDTHSYYVPDFLDRIDEMAIREIGLYKVLILALVFSLIPAIAIDPIYFVFTVGILVTNVVLYAMGKYKFERHLSMMGAVIGVVNTAQTLMREHNEVVKPSLKKDFIPSKPLNKAVKRIGFMHAKVMMAANGDLGAMIFDYVLGATLWDFFVFDRTVKVLKAHQADFLKLYQLVGMVDVWLSVASLRVSTPHCCEPTFHDEKNVKMEGLYHPLLMQPVANDLEMTTSFIVTGSNASGKSTYIKAIAINLILAQSFYTCMAHQAHLPYTKVMTSMAVRDDVSSGESYYIKEVNYLKRIVDQVHPEKLTFVVIDEILRGTNTQERVAASVAILQHLHGANCLAIVASHDVRISELLEDQYENFHFSEAMSDGDIVFDYQVKPGVSRSKNAIKLLKHMGFPESIVTHAESLTQIT